MEGGGNILLDDQARVAVTALTILSTFISPTQGMYTMTSYRFKYYIYVRNYKKLKGIWITEKKGWYLTKYM